MVEKRCWTTNRIAAVEAAKGIAEKWRSDGKSGLPWEDEAADFHALADGFLELFNAEPLKLIADLAAENARLERNYKELIAESRLVQGWIKSGIKCCPDVKFPVFDALIAKAPE